VLDWLTVHIRQLIPLAIALGLLATFPLSLFTTALVPTSSVSAAEGTKTRADVIGVDEIKPGMKGYGLTVFEGTEPGKFDVEVIDVLRNFRPHQDLILVKTDHPRLRVAKVVAGMSGSPIFLDGKMAGAYAYGWSFGAEPVAGVTPIRNMLEDLGRPIPKVLYGWPLFGNSGVSPKQASLGNRPQLGGNRYAGDLLDYDLLRHRDQIQRRVAPAGRGDLPIQRVSTPVLMGGMTEEAVAVAKDLLAPLHLEPMQAGGGGGSIDPTAPTRYVDGGAVGVQLVRGDVSAMGLGTVTRVEGDLVSGFGHPMMNAGATALPTSVGRVLWFLASQARSFKIGMPVRPVGALVNDRQASIVLSQRAQAPVIPVRVRIHGAEGAPYTDWNFEAAHEKFMAPSFVALAVGSALASTTSEKQDVTWSIKSTLAIKDHGDLVVEDFGVAVGGTPEVRALSRSNLVGAVAALLNNPWEPAFVEGIAVDVHISYSRDMYRLRGVEVLDPEVDPGESARVRLTFQTYDGPDVRRTIKLPLPRHLAGEKVNVDVNPGYRVKKEKAPPENLGDLVTSLRDPIYPQRSVVLSYSSGPGVAHRGQVASNLPAAAMDMISPQSTSLGPREFTSETHQVVDLPAFMTGRDKFTVEVRSIIE
jgi:hypothetical protein